MIHKYSMDGVRAWNRGDYKVQIMVPTHDRPIAWCDGTDEDLAELRAIAEEEGTELPTVQRRVLKTGREIWTIGQAPEVGDDEEYD